MNFSFQIIENAVQSFQLFWIICKKVKLKFFCFPVFQIFYQQIKLAVECRLFFGIEIQFQMVMCQ